MNLKRFVFFAYFVVFLAGCANVGGQLQVLSPAKATAISGQSQPTTQVTSLPAATATQVIATQAYAPTSGVSADVTRILSPDKRWTAIIDDASGSLDAIDSQGAAQTLFPSGSGVNDARWSSDSTRLAIAVSQLPQSTDATGSMQSPQVYVSSLEGSTFSTAAQIYQAPEGQAGSQVSLGTWSPDDHQLLFWIGPAGSSLQADGLPLWSLDVETGSTTVLSELALVNLAYQSWSPDSSAVVFTNGGYRSAQVGKSLSIYDVASGQTTTVIAQDKLVSGLVSWSPDGKTIAFAAVESSRTGAGFADSMGWDNPAILARRIYLLDVATKQVKRLNDADSYQDAPHWSQDGKTLYYVQVDQVQAAIMSADPSNGIAHAIAGCQSPLPAEAGYYGQVDWTTLYDTCQRIQ